MERGAGAGGGFVFWESFLPSIPLLDECRDIALCANVYTCFMITMDVNHDHMKSLNCMQTF